MITKNKKYVIATKTFPLKFLSLSGHEVSDFNDACIDTLEEMEFDLKNLEKPENYQILEVRVTYEF